MNIQRHFTKEDTHPFDTITWTSKDAILIDSTNTPIFEQPHVEAPDFWSQQAINIVANKYFFGKLGTPKRESSIKEIITRVAETITNTGTAQKYFTTPDDAQNFQDELIHILVHQKAAFNSPVWFNCGTIQNTIGQSSACFINSIEDSIESITEFVKTEGLLFKYGSGSGVNISSLRSKLESVSGGGYSCFPSDQKVLTLRGYVPITELIPNKDMVKTPYGARAVTHIHENGIGDIHTVTFSDGREIHVTPNHKFIAVTSEGKLEKHPIGTILSNQPDMYATFYIPFNRESKTPITNIEGDSILVDHISTRPFKKKNIHFTVSTDWAWLLGIIIGDGHIHRTKRRSLISITCNINDIRTIEKIEKILQQSNIIDNYSRNDNPELGRTDISIYDSNLVDALDSKNLLKNLSSDARIPDVIFTASKNIISAFLSGYLDADGYVSSSENRISWKSANKDLLLDAQELLSALSIMSSIIDSTGGREEAWRLEVVGHISKEITYQNFVKHSTKIQKAHFNYEKSKFSWPFNALKLFVHDKTLRSQLSKTIMPYNADSTGYLAMSRIHDALIEFGYDNDAHIIAQLIEHIPIEVTSIIYEDTCDIYDITVDDVHQYIVNGIVVSNSGPVAFMKLHDANASTIKSGGRTRRSAKMVIMNDDHPDIIDFITCKGDEEKKSKILMENGYEREEASDSVYFQNANHSVRVSDDFMNAVLANGNWDTHFVTTEEVGETHNAKDLLKRIAQETYNCGDPGIQFDDTINKWHTCPNDGRQVATNPCITGDTFVTTHLGLIKIEDLYNEYHLQFKVKSFDNEYYEPKRIACTGTKPVYKLTTKKGYSLKLTGDHKVYTLNRGDVSACELTKDDQVQLVSGEFGNYDCDPSLALLVGLGLGDGCISQGVFTLTMGHDERKIVTEASHIINILKLFTHKTHPRHTDTGWRVTTSTTNIITLLSNYGVFDKGSDKKQFTDNVFTLNKTCQIALLRGLFTADGTVANYSDKSQYVSLDSTSLTLLEQTQMLLLNFGIVSKIYKNRRAGKDTALLPDGQGGLKEYTVKEMHSLRISKSSRVIFEQEINFMANSKKSETLSKLNESISTYNDHLIDNVNSIKYLGEKLVYDITEPETSHFIANGIAIHNCSEYLFLNDTSCNLASINLLKFYDESPNHFDIEGFLHTVHIMFIAQDILIDNSTYPTEKIKEGTLKYRNIGLGYTNLGAYLMVYGTPYDSITGRGIAKDIASLLTAKAYVTSTELSQEFGAFPKFEENKSSMINIIRQHNKLYTESTPISNDIQEAAHILWEEACNNVTTYGVRNAQVSVLAPTGCLEEDTLILTSEGLLPLYEIGNTEGETWQDVTLNVATDTDIQEATKFYVNGEQETIKISTEHGHTITGTYNHKIRVINHDGEYIWKQLQDIDDNDYIAVKIGGHEQLLKNKRPVKLNQTILNDPRISVTPPKEVSEQLAEILGYYQGDGYLKDTYGITFFVDNKDDDLKEYLKTLLQDTFSKEYCAEEQRQGCIAISLVSRMLPPWFRANNFDKPKGNYGEGSSGAFIPMAILKSNTATLCAFLRGLFEADGTTHGKYASTVSLSTTSELLAQQVFTALWALGIKSNIRKVNHKIDTSRYGSRPLWRVSICGGKYTDIFKEKIGFLSRRKQEILAHRTQNKDQERNPIHHPGLILDFYTNAKNLSNEVKHDIRVRVYQGTYKLEWALTLCEKYDDLKKSKLYHLFKDKDVLVAQVRNIEYFSKTKTFDISVPNKNTYIANGFVSHNTISFLMDCDTTGVEPELSLVKYKSLSGGGQLKIVNNSVKWSLENLGYSDEDVLIIAKHIEEHGTVEGSILYENHLPIFDCSLGHGNRVIDYHAHINMLAEIQPYISGSISKTINVPNDITVEEIMELYIEAWKKGLKCVAIYRDGSKSWQPLNVKEETIKHDVPTPLELNNYGVHWKIDKNILYIKPNKSNGWVPLDTILAKHPYRMRLPDERASITHKFDIGGHEGYITVGLYNNGSPGELFIVMSKEGSTISGLVDAFATAVSIALQYGVPLEKLSEKFKHTRFEPSGFTQNQDIRMTHSILDYIFRWLELKFIKHEAKEEVTLPTLSSEKPLKKVTDEGPPCLVCGTTMVRQGTCYYCQQCGSTSGCS